MARQWDAGHLFENAAGVADLSKEDRIAFVRRGFVVPTDDFTTIQGKIDDLLEHVIAADPDPPHLLVVGESGSGKSTAFRDWYIRHPRYEDENRECAVVPAAFIEMPSQPSVGSILNLILQALGYEPEWKSMEFRQWRVDNLLRFLQTRIIMIDEVQHSIAAGVKGQPAIRNTIKAFGNLGIGTVVSGTKEALSFFNDDPQLKRRFWPPHKIVRLAKDPSFRRTLLTIERSLPLRLPSRLSDRDLAQRLHAMSNGTIEGLWKVIQRAAIAAIESERECITEALLQQVWQGEYLSDVG